MFNLSAQRVGMTVGLAVTGVLYAAIFTGLYYLARRAAPGWLPPALTIMFRTFTAVGHFLLWMGVALGAVGYLFYRRNGVHGYPAPANGSPGAADQGA